MNIFTEALIPAITRYAKVRFSYLKGEAREEMEQECLALGWARYLRLCERGRDPSQWPSLFAQMIARSVAKGRRVCGQAKAKDVATRLQRVPLGAPVAHRVASVWYAAHFRDAFPRWVASLTPTNRRVCQMLAEGGEPKQVAENAEVTPSRVSQIRKHLEANWQAFCEV